MERLLVPQHEARTRLPQPALPPAPAQTVPGAGVYCIVAGDIDGATAAALRAHLGEHEITLVVDQRAGDRRNVKRSRRRPRRLLGGRTEIERRSVRHVHGRRVAERRGETEPGPVALLPRELASTVDGTRVRFVVMSPVDPETERDVAAARHVIRYQSGDQDTAFVALFESYADPVRQFARAALHDPDAAEDICQQVFMEVSAGLSSYEVHSAPFRAWVFRIARTCIVERLGGPEPLLEWHRADQPMRAAFIPRRLAVAGFSRSPRSF